MSNIEILAEALDYIENHLQSEIKTSDVAGACYCSKSTVEKIFRCVNHISVHDYVIRRRMMLAARMIRNDPSVNLLDIALFCGYGTNESFSRAFKSVWGCNPSEFKSSKSFYELFPRILPPSQNGGAFMKNVDISEMYDLFCQRKNCWFVCCDIKELIPINEISRKAGDYAILETMNRMQNAAGENDIVFRIGGDEFVILTDSEAIDYAENIVSEIERYNGKPFLFDEKEIPLTLYASCCKYEGGSLNYRNLYEQLLTNIAKNK